MKIHSLLLLILLGTLVHTHAQKPDLKDESVLMELLQMSENPLDADAKAVTLYTKGKTDIINLSSRYKLEAVIKVFSGEVAREAGTLVIPRMKGVVIKNLSATIYNLEDGAIKSKTLEQGELIKEQVIDGLGLLKVYLPDVKKGSVISYQFEREAGDLSLLLGSWNFQDQWPCLHSEYEANIPGYILYDAILRVNADVVTVQSKKDLRQPGAALVYREPIAEISNSQNIWIRRNIPAFKEEPYMSSAENYQERVKLHVKAFSVGGVTHNLNFNWDEICYKRYYSNPFFAKDAFGKNNFLNETVSRLTASANSSEDQARALYDFVRDSIESYNGADANDYVKIKDAFQKRSGSNYELNLLLVAMLRNADLRAFPVLLSTTENEKLNNYFPDPSNINYMVTMLHLDNDTLFLDPTNKYLSFGYLPNYCLNGYARVINEKGGDVELTPTLFKNKTNIMVQMLDDKESEQLIAKIDIKYGHLTSYSLRKACAGDTALMRQNIEKQLDDGYELKSFSSNLLETNNRLLVRYELVRPSSVETNFIYINPYVQKLIPENPFPAVERKYPVELPYLRDVQYLLTYQLPKGFQPVEPVDEDKTWLLNEQKDLGFMNKIQFDSELGLLKVFSRYTENNNYLSAEQYQSLREFYEGVLQEQNKKITFKKI